MGRWPKEFRRRAVERLKTCDNIVALSKELGVHRRLLYKWRDQFAPFDESAEPVTGSSAQAADWPAIDGTNTADHRRS
jgi:transposase-like protein